TSSVKTTTTLPAEVCGNCIDDDGDGLVDDEDSACCPQQGTLDLRLVHLHPRRNRSTGILKIHGRLIGADFAQVDPTRVEVSLQATDADVSLACCTLAQGKVMRVMGKGAGFWDPKRHLSPPFRDMSIKRSSDGKRLKLYAPQV